MPLRAKLAAANHPLIANVWGLEIGSFPHRRRCHEQLAPPAAGADAVARRVDRSPQSIDHPF
jgi:hypothetical protein